MGQIFDDRAELAAAPDYLAPLVGYREWLVTGERGHWQLRAPFRHTPWARTMTAVCGAGHGHSAPDHGCDCGIYALKIPPGKYSRVDLAFAPGIWRRGTENGGYQLTVWGSVDLWGTVEEHRDGYRAGRASIACLFATPVPTLGLGRPLRQLGLRLALVSAAVIFSLAMASYPGNFASMCFAMAGGLTLWLGAQMLPRLGTLKRNWKLRREALIFNRICGQLAQELDVPVQDWPGFWQNIQKFYPS